MGHTRLIIGLYGVVFHGEDASDFQKSIAPQNIAKNLKKYENKNRKNNLETKMYLDRQKKCWGLSETCVAEV